MTELHRRYGHIVRISPNRLAVDGSIAWSQVYGHRHGKEEFSKVRDYFFPGDGITLIQGNLENHRRQRRQLAPGFSDAALTKQEPILMRHISKLIRKLDDAARRREPVDVTRWLTLMTFDVISDLIFTDGFHSLDDTRYQDWAVGSFQAMRGQAFRRFMDALPLLRPLIGLLMSTDDIKHNDRRRQLAAVVAMDKIRSVAQEEPGAGKRSDLISLMLGEDEDGQRRVHEHELLANVSILLPAGSETTATALCGIFYYLGRHPGVYEILAREIRTAFSSESDITIKSTARLSYLVAVIEEVLRIYPPGAETPPRVSPGDTVGGYYIPKGVSAPCKSREDHQSRIFRVFSLNLVQTVLQKQYPLFKFIVKTLLILDRLGSPHISGQVSTTPKTLPIPTPSILSAGCRPHTRSMIIASTAIIALSSSPSVSGRVTASADLLHIARCVSFSLV